MSWCAPDPRQWIGPDRCRRSGFTGGYALRAGRQRPDPRRPAPRWSSPPATQLTNSQDRSASSNVADQPPDRFAASISTLPVFALIGRAGRPRRGERVSAKGVRDQALGLDDQVPNRPHRRGAVAGSSSAYKRCINVSCSTGVICSDQPSQNVVRSLDGSALPYSNLRR